jgi:hypothetical protein
MLVLGERRFLEPRIRSALPRWMQDELIECEVPEFFDEVRRWR